MNTAKTPSSLPRPESTQWHRKSSGPLDPQCHPVPVRYLVLYLIHLLGHELLAFLCPSVPSGRQPVREFLKYNGGCKLLSPACISPCSMAFR
jgi:hypothetical protein